MQTSMSDNENVVRMFWHGTALSAYERLSIASFLKHGHRVEVFSYNELSLPDGAVRVDAESHLHAALENPATHERATALRQQIFGTTNS